MVLYASDLGMIQADYNKLKQDSETGRYECSDIHTAEEARQFILLVDHIKDHISPLL